MRICVLKKNSISEMFDHIEKVLFSNFFRKWRFVLVGMCEIVILSDEKQFMYERANEKKRRGMFYLNFID